MENVPLEDELRIELSEQVKDAIARDPELAASMREMFAIFHQAVEGVRRGQYADFESALEILTGNRPERLIELLD